MTLHTSAPLPRCPAARLLRDLAVARKHQQAVGRIPTIFPRIVWVNPFFDDYLSRPWMVTQWPPPDGCMISALLMASQTWVTSSDDLRPPDPRPVIQQVSWS
jgi:hypothetical protein